MKSNHIQRVINNPKLPAGYRDQVLNSLRGSGALSTYHDSFRSLVGLKNPTADLKTLETILMKSMLKREPDYVTNKIMDRFLSHTESGERIRAIFAKATLEGAREPAITRLKNYILKNEPESGDSYVENVYRTAVFKEPSETNVDRFLAYLNERESESILINILLVNVIYSHAPQSEINKLLEYGLNHQSDSELYTASHVLCNSIRCGASKVTVIKLLDHVLEYQPKSGITMNYIYDYALSCGADYVSEIVRPFVALEKDKV